MRISDYLLKTNPLRLQILVKCLIDLSPYEDKKSSSVKIYPIIIINVINYAKFDFINLING